jgi:hypothetical protein
MDSVQNSRLFVLGGMSGIAGTLCYILTAVVPFGQTLTYALAMAWPVLSVIFVFSMVQYLEINRPSPVNQLAFVFSALGFAMVAGMISIQLAVRNGMEEYLATSPGKEELLLLMRRSIRLVDMGLDVAWDLFIGTALIFLSISLVKHDHFGVWWSVPSGLLGMLLIVLNVVTFPWPPDTRGLFDIGPAIGLFIIALSVRLLLLGIRLKHPLGGHAAS